MSVGADGLQAAAEWVGGLPTVVRAAAVLLAALVAARLVEFGANRLAARLEPGAETFPQLVVRDLRAPLYAAVLLLGLLAAWRLSAPPAFLWPVEPAIRTAVVIVVGYAAVRLGRLTLERLQDGDRRYEFAPLVANFWSLFVVIVAGISVLSVWDVSLTPLLASAGVLGLVIGFAARDAIANLVGGVALYFDDTYRLGDFVVLESGQRGTVVDIGLRSTTLLTRDRVMVTVPNSVLNSTQVINESSPRRSKRIRVPVRVAYGTDADRLERLLLEVAADADNVIDNPRPQVHFGAFGDAGLEYELRAYVPHPTTEPHAVDELNTAIYDRLAAAGIEIPYPQRDVRFREGSRVRPEAGETPDVSPGPPPGRDPEPDSEREADPDRNPSSDPAPRGDGGRD